MRRSAWGFRGGQGGAARGERGRSSAPLLALRSVGDRRLQRAPLEWQAGRRRRRGGRRGRRRRHGRGWRPGVVLEQHHVAVVIGARVPAIEVSVATRPPKELIVARASIEMKVATRPPEELIVARAAIEEAVETRPPVQGIVSISTWNCGGGPGGESLLAPPERASCMGDTNRKDSTRVVPRRRISGRCRPSHVPPAPCCHRPPRGSRRRP